MTVKVIPTQARMPTIQLPLFFFSSRRRHTRSLCDWSSDVCSSDLPPISASPAIAPITAYRRHTLGGGFGGGAIFVRGTELVIVMWRELSGDKSASAVSTAASVGRRSEERRVGKEWRCRGAA